MTKLKRREFIVGGAGAVAGLTVFSQLRATLAAARSTGKPLLTESNLNAFARANPLTTTKGQSVSADAARNLESFISEHFTVTDEQRSELATISRADRQKIADIIQQARSKRGLMRIRIVDETASVGRKQPSSAHHAVPVARTITIGTEVAGNTFSVSAIKKHRRI